MTSDDICANCGQDIAYGCGCTERVRLKAELTAAQEENKRLREALEDIRDLKFYKMPYDLHSDDVNTMSKYARAALGKEG